MFKGYPQIIFSAEIKELSEFSPQNISLSGPETGEQAIKSNFFSFFPIKTYVVGTQKNRLIETVLLGTQNMC